MFETNCEQFISRCWGASRLHRLCLFLGLFTSAWTVTAHAQSFTGSIERPIVSIVIDDLGDVFDTGAEVIALPAALTYSFLPYTPFAIELAKMAAERHKEVMLHLPMQPIGDEKMGPGGLDTAMDEATFVRMVRANLAAIPYAIGVNNHMGSLLTRRIEPMRWLMRELADSGGYYFVDSVTSRLSVAGHIAKEMHVPTVSREVFLDHERDVNLMARHFNTLIERALIDGYAVAIGHPYPETIQFLRDNIHLLAANGVLLVPVSRLLEINERRRHTWQASLSPWRKVAKN